MKKIFALLLTVAMMLAVFTACGGDNTNTTNTSDPTNTGSESTSDTEANTEQDTTDTEKVTTEAPETTEPVVEPYVYVYVDENVKLIDDASTNATGGGSGNPIQFVDGNGVGYSSLNDIVYFENVDFSKGASAMTISFSNGNRNGTHTTLAVYIDDYQNSEPVCTFDIKYTGGWDAGYAKEFTVPCEIPAGTHTVYIQYTNTNSGSFTWASFVEAGAAS